ncbi:hypothetical protein P7K49_024747 [Saguinus oedipus]|uniref:Uncharacterized protein n=1 Tax=Saguinus oedipus TaxID=9490 RepID=A0ABQ9UQE9_SAGOE|nr:hypothetical protein P7K49_024747 [Saguinus oedipus]
MPQQRSFSTEALPALTSSRGSTGGRSGPVRHLSSGAERSRGLLSSASALLWTSSPARWTPGTVWVCSVYNGQAVSLLPGVHSLGMRPWDPWLLGGALCQCPYLLLMESIILTHSSGEVLKGGGTSQAPWSRAELTRLLALLKFLAV